MEKYIIQPQKQSDAPNHGTTQEINLFVYLSWGRSVFPEYDLDVVPQYWCWCNDEYECKNTNNHNNNNANDTDVDDDGDADNDGGGGDDDDDNVDDGDDDNDENGDDNDDLSMYLVIYTAIFLASACIQNIDANISYKHLYLSEHMQADLPYIRPTILSIIRKAAAVWLLCRVLIVHG